MRMYVLAAVLALGDLWLSYFLWRERERRAADNARSDRTLTWWRHYAGQIQRERRS